MSPPVHKTTLYRQEGRGFDPPSPRAGKKCISSQRNSQRPSTATTLTGREMENVTNLKRGGAVGGLGLKQRWRNDRDDEPSQKNM
jgi:hypothetical protein